MNLTKFQKEFYALEIYRSIYGLTDCEVKKSESPDFILWNKNSDMIGIEVTTPSNQEQNQLINIANCEERERLGKKNNYDKYKKDGKIHSYRVEIQSSSTRENHNIILSSIEKKFKKLNKNYELFNKNILCCTPIIAFLYCKDDHDYFIDGLNTIKDNYKNLFDEIIIIMYDKVVKYSINEEKNYLLVSEKDLSDELIGRVTRLVMKENE